MVLVAGVAGNLGLEACPRQVRWEVEPHSKMAPISQLRCRLWQRSQGNSRMTGWEARRVYNVELQRLLVVCITCLLAFVKLERK